uniref:Uncharacterized protein n=1 Tax=Micrurus lemniscatus lemniscatus TaxID=129467 RepID=A0A2D4JR82_MICLE
MSLKIRAFSSRVSCQAEETSPLSHTYISNIHLSYICFNPSQLHLVKFKSFPMFFNQHLGNSKIALPLRKENSSRCETVQNSSVYLKSVAFSLRTLKLIFQALYIHYVTMHCIEVE